MRKLGKGAYGEVWLARDENGRRVVIKIIDKPSVVKNRFRMMIEREKRIPKIIQETDCHPNIACMINFIETDQSYNIIYEYIPGKELSRWNIVKNDLELLDISYQLANAFKYLHSKGIAHRDIKTANIMITDQNIPVVIDFGFSCLYDETKLIYPEDMDIDEIENMDLILCSSSSLCEGTPKYIAPELVQFGTVNPNYFLSDVYSFGVVLYYLFNKKQFPVKITSNVAAKLRQEKKTPPIPSHSGLPIDSLIDQMVSTNPNDRPTMEEVVFQLKRIITQVEKFPINSKRLNQVFNPPGWDQMIRSYLTIPKVNSYSGYIPSSDRLYNFTPTSYEFRTEILILQGKMVGALVREWKYSSENIESDVTTRSDIDEDLTSELNPDLVFEMNEKAEVQLWVSTNAYAVLFIRDDEFLFMGNLNGRTFIIANEFNFQGSAPIETIDFPVLSIDQVKELVGDKLNEYL